MKLKLLIVAIIILGLLAGCQQKVEVQQPEPEAPVNNIPFSKGPSAPPNVKGPSSPPPENSSPQAVTTEENLKLTLPVQKN